MYIHKTYTFKYMKYIIVCLAVNTEKLCNQGVFYNTSKVSLVTISGCTKDIH